MRSIILTSLIGTMLLAPVAMAEDSVVRLSEPVNETETYEEFGATLPEGDAIHSLGDALAQADDLAGKLVLIETEVQKVCKKKGCFFIATDGDAVARVRFKDYGFFIPTDSAGKTVKLAGTIKHVELTPEQAAHFDEDLGEKPRRTGMAPFEYQIMATSVRIPRA